ncbi:unnamed protein product, partial [Didymodactylos carnosus]
ENGGFELTSGQSKEIRVPDNWESGRIWPRTGCKDIDGRFICATGSCGAAADNFGMECKGIGRERPATIAEFTLSDHAGNDFYDLSNVDGHNI